MTKLPTIYTLTSSGKVQQWTICVEDDQYWTEAGQVGGKIQTAKPTVCCGKNVGRSNETSPEQQALCEAQAKHQKKLDQGGTTDLNDVRNAAKRNFKPMLAKSWDKEKEKVNYPVFIQPKFDGIRCVLTSEGAFTRNGKSIVTIPHIIEEFATIFEKYPNAVFDGELYNHELKDDFNRICSLVKKTKPSISDLLESGEVIRYYVYDVAQLDDKITMDTPFSQRYKIYWELLWGTHSTSICPVLTEQVASSEEVDGFHDTFCEQGFEGAIVRVDAPYQQKRTSDLLKVKLFQDDEFQIVGVEEGRGNKAGLAAAIFIQLPNGKHCKAGMSGTDDFCRKVLADEDLLIGQMCTVCFFGYTPDGALRFPKVKTIRDYE